MGFKRCIVSLLGMLAVAPCYAQSSQQIVFRFLEEEIEAGGTKVFRGVEADPKYWRNVIVADFPTLTSRADYCTGTLVGPEAVLTSAHCLTDSTGKAVPAVVRVHDQDWLLSCLLSDKVKQDPSFDYALCRLTPPAGAGLPADLLFDALDTTPLSERSAVLLVGYGCETMSIGADRRIIPGPRTRAFRIGEEAISETAVDGSPIMLIESVSGEPALCPGDSGGPLISGASVKDQGASRSVRGVNFGVEPGSGGVKYRSMIAALSDPSFVQLLARWRTANAGALICQVGSTAGKGRCL